MTSVQLKEPGNPSIFSKEICGEMFKAAGCGWCATRLQGASHFRANKYANLHV
jgi:hypothetical protein